MNLMRKNRVVAVKLAESKVANQTTNLTREVYNTLNTMPNTVEPYNGRFMELSFQTVKNNFLQSVQNTYMQIKAIQSELNFKYDNESITKIKEYCIQQYTSSLETILVKHKQHVSRFAYEGYDDSSRYEWVKNEIVNEFERMFDELKIENLIKQEPTNIVIQKKQLRLAAWGLIITGGIGVILKLLIDNNFFQK
jgi:hypothetical protein